MGRRVPDGVATRPLLPGLLLGVDARALRGRGDESRVGRRPHPLHSRREAGARRRPPLTGRRRDPARSGSRPAGRMGVVKIWIAADAAPREVKELVFRAAKRLTIETVLVANQRLQTPVGNPLVSAVWVDGGADVADQHIASHAAPGDLVVTQDVPL